MEDVLELVARLNPVPVVTGDEAARSSALQKIHEAQASFLPPLRRRRALVVALGLVFVAVLAAGPAYSLGRRLADFVGGKEAPVPVKHLLNRVIPTPIEPATPIGKDARQLISIRASNGDTINLYVVSNTGGGLCRYVGLVSPSEQNLGLGGSCLTTDAPPLDRPLVGLTRQHGIDFVDAWVSPDVARMELRYANGETVLIPLVRGFGIIEVPPSHFAAEYSPISFRMITVDGRVISAGQPWITLP